MAAAITPLQAALAAVDHALAGLEALEPNRFRRQLRAAKTLAEQYLVICRLDYAAGAKELRETSDPRVHVSCDRLQACVAAVDALVRERLRPQSEAEAEAWQRACLAVEGGRFFRLDDGGLDVLLLDAGLGRDGLLRVRRLWTHVSDCDGRATDLRIPVSRPRRLALRLDGLRGEQPYPSW